MEVVVFGLGRRALAFGEQKINLHQQGAEFEPKAQSPTPGSADLCLLTHTPLDGKRVANRILRDVVAFPGLVGRVA